MEACRTRVSVQVTPEAWKRVRDSNAVLLAAASAGQQIYGLTTGVGANKDQSAVQGNQLFDAKGEPTDEFRKESSAFNKALLHAHAAGMGDPLSAEMVRAILLIRLNTALTGGSGMEEDLVRRYVEFLNHDILPVIPSRGSVGEADITILSHIGLTMIGEWEVTYEGIQMPAKEALDTAGLPPIEMFGKDALASFSSNAFSAAEASFALAELRQAARIARLVYALSLEGLNGNIAPLLAEPSMMRPFPYAAAVAKSMRYILSGSYLTQSSENRPLQDPLSFRTALYQLGALDRSLDELENLLTLQLNSSDDNPVVYLGDPDPFTLAQPGIVPISKETLRGVVVPSANFSPLPYAIALETAALAAAHVSKGSQNRTFRMANEHFTNLKRFLGSEETVHAFGAIQKPINALVAENQELANPVSLNFTPIAINVEDMATNTPLAARRLRTMADNLMALLGFETMHAAQAMDLRLRSDPAVQMAPKTATFLENFRKQVPFLEKDDQILTRDIAKATAFIRKYKVKLTEL